MYSLSALSSAQNFFIHEEVGSSLGHLSSEINPQNHIKMLEIQDIVSETTLQKAFLL